MINKNNEIRVLIITKVNSKIFRAFIVRDLYLRKYNNNKAIAEFKTVKSIIK